MPTLAQVREAAQKAGINGALTDRLLALLAQEQQQSEELTIICNEGIHPIPKEQLPGLVFSATVGNLPDQTPEELQAAVANACRRTAEFIKQARPFREIYLVPSGYGVVLQKLAEVVFQITGRPATSLHFDRRSGSYWPIRLDVRRIVASV